MKTKILWAAMIASTALVAASAQAETNAGIDACIATVGAKHPGKIVKVERKTEKGEPVYEFDVHGTNGKMYDIECSAKTGQITEVEEEVETPDHPAFKPKVKVTLDQAKQTALKQHPGEITEIEYEVESDGAASYEFDIVGKDGKEIKVEVDATTGAIVEANEELWQIGVE
jgi:uncharacterized membrane protein YkoI